MENEAQQVESGARKPCVACGELIPANASVCSHCMQRQTSEKPAPFKLIMTWVGATSALIGLGASILGGVRWVENHQQQKKELASQMAVAEVQARQEQYGLSVRSYDQILKDNPLYRPALDEQLHTAMLWVENFHVLASGNQNAADLAASELDEVMAILNSGMARTKGSDAADVQAHLGWAHWLNQHIAKREFGPLAEQNLRAALQTDPSNVYANAMLGNWMLQNHGNFTEAVGHLEAAASTGKARPLVRAMQLSGLIYNETHGARAELVKAANEMQKNGEPLEEDQKRRILAFCFNPTVTNRTELTGSISAAPEDDLWKTYLWLDDTQDEGSAENARLLNREFVYANLLEVSGKRAESLEKYKALQQELKNHPGTLKDSVDAAIARLSRS